MPEPSKNDNIAFGVPVGDETFGLEEGLRKHEDGVAVGTKALAGPTIGPSTRGAGRRNFGYRQRNSNPPEGTAGASCGFVKTAKFMAALFLHGRKVALLNFVLAQGVAYNMMKMLTHKNHRIIDYTFCTAGIFLGVSLVVSSSATLLMKNPSASLKAFLQRRGGRHSVAEKFSESHFNDQLRDAVVGMLIVNSSVNSLTWYISNLPLMPWTEVPGHYAWHVSSWLICVMWAAFALGVYCKSQVAVTLPSCFQSLPSPFTTRTFAFLQLTSSSKLARLCIFLAVCANVCIVTMMAWEVNIAQRAGSSANFEKKRALYGGVLIVSDSISLLSEALKPCIINGWLYVCPGLTRLLSLCCLSIAVVLVALPHSHVHLLTTCVVTVLLHILGSISAAFSLMQLLSRRARLITLEPPIDKPTHARDRASPSFRADRPERNSPVSMGMQPLPSLAITELEPDLSHESNRPLRILCLDGGGAKGMNTVLMLQAIEKRCGKPIQELFDLICGTSMGACVGAGAALGTNMDFMMDLLEGLCYKGCDSCGPVFPTRSLWRLLTKGWKMSESAASDYMHHVTETLGCGGDKAFPAQRAHDGTVSGVPHYFSVTTQEQPGDRWLPFIVSNYPRDAQGFAVDGVQGWPLQKQLLASTAAPTFFRPVVDPHSAVQYVDGGIVANNPSLIAVQEAKAIWPGRPIGCIVSLGTGESVATGQSKAGLIYWAGKMLSMPTDTYRVHKEIESAIPSLNEVGCAQPSYFRLEPVIPNLELDECRKYVLDDMKKITAEYISAKCEHMDNLCSALLELSGESSLATA